MREREVDPDRHHVGPAPASPCCRAPSWWNGWRRVFGVVLAAVGAVLEREVRWLARARCKVCNAGFTLYPPGWQPGQQYQPDAKAVAVAARVGEQVSLAKAGERVEASATSVARWTRWVGDLVDPSEALRLAAQIDPSGTHGAGMSAREEHTGPLGRVSRVLEALEALGAALVHAGVELVSVTGLGRVLEWQRAVARRVVVVTAGVPSPRTVLGGEVERAVASCLDGHPGRPEGPARLE